MNEVPLFAGAYTDRKHFGLGVGESAIDGVKDGGRKFSMVKYRPSTSLQTALSNIDVYLEEAEEPTERHHSLSDGLCRRLNIRTLDKC